MAKLIVAFRDVANAPKNPLWHFAKSQLLSGPRLEEKRLLTTWLQLRHQTFSQGCNEDLDLLAC